VKHPHLGREVYAWADPGAMAASPSVNYSPTGFTE